MSQYLPKVSKRHRAGYYNCNEVADMLGLAHETFVYHVRRGYIPAPQAMLGGRRRYYSRETALAVMEYFRGRSRHERHK